jgi:co-chaperonin GroES (HSP10)
MLSAPMATKVIVELPPPPEKVGSLFVLKPSVHRPSDGKVVSLGSEVKNIKFGDRVFFKWEHGGAQHFEHGGKPHLLLNEQQVLAIIE